MDRTLCCMKVHFTVNQDGGLTVQISSGSYPSTRLSPSEVSELRDWLIRVTADDTGTDKWQPISTIPRSTSVLLYHPAVGDRHIMPPVIRVGFAGEWPNRPATHWMLLPTAPDTGSKP